MKNKWRCININTEWSSKTTDLHQNQIPPLSIQTSV
jgi:hypothetical protein